MQCAYGFILLTTPSASGCPICTPKSDANLRDPWTAPTQPQPPLSVAPAAAHLGASCTVPFDTSFPASTDPVGNHTGDASLWHRRPGTGTYPSHAYSASSQPKPPGTQSISETFLHEANNSRLGKAVF